ncbi:MAG: hypothetical protein M3536_13250 [Actinomycetota bacterium]|nr:hypothetical protein [Actinomycetota bacterium]
MAKLNTYVHVHDKDGVSHAFGPDDTLPEWAEALITNPDVWAEKPESDDLPDGDIDDTWTVKQLKAYAKAEEIDLGDAKSKADILTKIAE